jgi:uncharacterized damage-inducible protein DinB
MKYVLAIPEDSIDWAPQVGEMTCGEIIRHIGAIQLMNWTVVKIREWNYPGHRRELGASKQKSIACLENYHQRAIQIISELDDQVLYEKVPDVNENPITAWRLLMASVEHEIHHRSQLGTYLFLLKIQSPQLFDVYFEDLPEH